MKTRRLTGSATRKRGRLFGSLAAAAMCLAALGCDVPVPLVSAAATSAGASGECANDYFPAVQGASWNYAITGDVPGALTRTITSVTPDGFRIEDALAPGGARTSDWSCSDGIIAAKPDGMTSGLLQAKDLTASLDTTDNSGVTVPDNLGEGAVWNQDMSLAGTEPLNGKDVPAKNHVTTDCSVVGTESINVPAGKFVALRAECKTSQHLTLNGADVSTDVVSAAIIWYAQGVGVVQADEAATDGPKSTIVLTSYKFP